MQKLFHFKQRSLNIKTILFEPIHFSISIQFSSIWPCQVLSSQSGPGSNGNEGVLHITLDSCITGTSPSDCLVPYPGHTLEGVLPLCRDALYLSQNCNTIIHALRYVIKYSVKLQDNAKETFNKLTRVDTDQVQSVQFESGTSLLSVCSPAFFRCFLSNLGKPTRNFEPRPLFNPQVSLALIPLTITRYTC